MQSRIRRLRHREFDGIPRGRLDHTVDALSIGATQGRLDEVTFTADAETNEIDTGDLLNAGDRVMFYGSDLPAGLVAGQFFYLGLNDPQDGIVVFTDAARSDPVDITDAGTGTHTLIVI